MKAHFLFFNKGKYTGKQSDLYITGNEEEIIDKFKRALKKKETTSFRLNLIDGFGGLFDTDEDIHQSIVKSLS